MQKNEKSSVGTAGFKSVLLQTYRVAEIAYSEILCGCSYEPLDNFNC